MKILLSLLLVLALAAPCEAQKEHLALKLSVGDTYRRTIRSAVSTEGSIKGQSYASKSVGTVTTTFTVMACCESVYTIEVQYKSFSLKSIGPRGSEEWDSEKHDSTDLFSTVLGNMMNEPLAIYMSQTGRVSRVEGFEKVYARAFDKLPTLTEIQKQATKAKLAQVINETTLKDDTELLTAIFPEAPVDKEEKWTIVTHPFGHVLPMNVTNTYELKDITSTEYIISSITTLTTDKDSKAELGGLAVRWDLIGTGTSTFKLNKQTNWVIEGAIHRSTSGSAIFQNIPKVPGGMTMPMTVTSETVISENESFARAK